MNVQLKNGWILELIIHFGKHEKIIRTWQDHVNFVHRKKKSPISSARWTFTCKPQFGCHSFWKTVRLNDRAILLWQDQQSKLFFLREQSKLGICPVSGETMKYTLILRPNKIVHAFHQFHANFLVCCWMFDGFISLWFKFGYTLGHAGLKTIFLQNISFYKWSPLSSFSSRGRECFCSIK